MLITTLATLGRISNLPTVWSNILAATVVAQTSAHAQTIHSDTGYIQIAIIVLALSLMYIGGMFLNDAFDTEWDRKNNNMRPIVRGEISRNTVWVLACLILISGLCLLISLDKEQASIAALALCSIIVLYNALHKRFPAAAFLMGLTRFFVYIISALLLAPLSATLVILATGLLLYITAVTFLARQEQINKIFQQWPLILLTAPLLVTISFAYPIPLYWLFVSIYSVWISIQVKTKILAATPDIRSGIGGLLAAIPLVDGLYLASMNALIPSIICLMIFFLVPQLHKYISGT